MIKLATKIPKGHIFIACSGGADSMVLLDFFRRTRQVTVLHVNHGTKHGKEAEEFITKKCAEFSLDLKIKYVSSTKNKNESLEEFWRNKRMEFFTEQDGPVLTAHHLNDAMEWWVFSALHGNPKLVPVRNENILRPLLLTSRKQILEWAERKSVEYIDDPSNKEVRFRRNFIRHEIIPRAFVVNPGLEKTIRKKYLSG